MGNTQSITDAKGNITNYIYDALNRQSTITYPDGTSKEYQYDPNGNIIKRIGTDNVATNYIYDALDRQTTKSYANGTSCTFAYDNLSRVTTATNPNVTIGFEYDLNGRLAKEIVNGTEEIVYSYDVPNRKATITYPSGRVVEEEMDYSQRLILVKQNNTTVASLTYEGYSISQKAFNNGLTTNYNHDLLGRTTSMTVNPDAVFHFEYEYNNLGDKTAQRTLHQPDLSETYAYDNVNRLINYKKGTVTNGDIPNPDDQIDFQYDALGNRVSLNRNGSNTTYESNNLNSYTSVSSGANMTGLTYSVSGNLMDDGQNAYTYDADNRLLTVNANILYKYDALGRRYQKIVDGTTTTYYYYYNQVIQETDSNGNTEEHIYAGASQDHLLATIRGSNTYYYHLNTLRSVMGVSDAAGAVVERYTYTPYGTPTVYDNNYSELTASAIGNSFYFTGKELDEESNLYYSRSRHYHHQLGRFMQRDPVSYQDGMNLYQYVSSNPINYIDPHGLTKCQTFEYGGGTDDKKNTRHKFTKVGGRGGLSKLKAAISVKISGKTCEKCCKETNSMGTTYEAEASVSGSFSYAVDGLSFFPASRAVDVAAKAVGIDLFGGIIFSGSASGGANLKRDECGNVSGGGCVSAEVSASGQISGTADSARNDDDKTTAKNSVGISISNSYNVEACYKCTGGSSCKWECSSSFKGEAKGWINVEYTWFNATVSVNKT